MGRAFGISFLFAFTTFYSGAWAQSSCDVVLQTKAFDISSNSVTLRTAYDKKEQICQQKYRSVEEFRSAASSSGFDLGFKGVQLGASGGNADQSGNLSFESEAFCRANEEQFAQEYESEGFQQIASIAVQAWERCVIAQRSNAVWMSYQRADDGSGFTGTIYRTISVGSVDRLKLTQMLVQGSDIQDSDIVCSASNDEITPAFFDDGQTIEFGTLSENISCNKPVNKTVSVSFGTDQGALPWIELPSVEKSNNTDIAELDRRLSRYQEEVAQRLTTMQADMIGQVSPLQSAGQNLQLEQTVQAQRLTSLETATTDISNLSLLGQIQAQAICTALAADNNDNYYWVHAVPREASNTAPSCAAICQNTEPGPGAGTSRIVFGSLYIYPNQPSRTIGTSGLMTHIYMPSDNNRSFGGPNVCCCASR